MLHNGYESYQVFVDPQGIAQMRFNLVTLRAFIIERVDFTWKARRNHVQFDLPDFPGFIHNEHDDFT